MSRTTRRALLILGACALAAACTDVTTTAPTAPVGLTNGNPLNTGSKNAYTLAVIGDTPYGAAKMAEFPALRSLMNGDPKVDIVVHLGDIKAGSSSPCTDAYFAQVRALFDAFSDPFVYTPGDNEWTDCHAAGKNNGLYTPTERLQAVREVFFPVAGQTLGGRKKQVLTQADDVANGEYVENVMWMEAQTIFATFNIPGSNNDRAAWGSPLPADAGNYPSQAGEIATRGQANHDWLEKTFAAAAVDDAAGVVLILQADMWDPTASLNGFDALVQQIGMLAGAFGKPVLLLEGDSHRFNVDNPYSATSPFHGLHPSTPVVPNITRVVSEGSDGRTEYIRLTVDPNKKGDALFSWERVPLVP